MEHVDEIVDGKFTCEMIGSLCYGGALVERVPQELNIRKYHTDDEHLQLQSSRYWVESLLAKLGGCWLLGASTRVLCVL